MARLISSHSVMICFLGDRKRKCRSDFMKAAESQNLMYLGPSDAVPETIGGWKESGA